MQVITLNVNGIRAAAKKGLFRWLAEQQADVICLQEIRAPKEVLESDLYQLAGYHCYYESAEKKGYSGVGILTRKKPDKVVARLGFPLADDEGRYLHVEFGNLIIASLYLPSGTSGESRQALKYQFLDRYEVILKSYLNAKQSWIICGDWNIAHKQIDLKNWRSNQKNSGFLPEERAWLDGVFGKMGFVDAFREVNQEAEQYTWWSHRGRAWENNTGWRIDYQVLTPDLRKTVKDVSIYKDERFSDHAPLIINYDISASGI
ncbi:MAG: exodeoxyribonuclease III [Candidatus Berkiellales bacterium]